MMKFRVDFSVDGLVSRTGNNLVLSVGKLIGSMAKIDEEDSVRKIYAYKANPYEISRKINIEIPQGFRVEGIETKILTSRTSKAHLFLMQK